MASTTLDILDGTGATKLLRAWQNSDNSLGPQSCIEVEGVPVSTAAPLPVALETALPGGTNAIGSVSQVTTALSNSASVTCSATPGTASVLVAFNANRKLLIIYNRSVNSETVDIGSSNVAEGGGIPLAPGGGGFQFVGPGAAGPVYGISPTASTPMSYVEG